MSVSTSVKNNRWIRWMGVASSIAILFIMVLVGGTDTQQNNQMDRGVLSFVVFGFLPAFVSVFTSIAKRFWPNLIIGLWYLYACRGIPTGGGGGATLLMLFSLSALALSSTPILNIIFGRKNNGKINSSVKSE
jgi:hypothetical protein